MGVMQMAQRIKKIHPDYILIFKVGVFCKTFGKDSYIIASIFDYILKTSKIATCGFSKKVLRKSFSSFRREKDKLSCA